ncbi:hypothetical protein [Faecalibacter sp. LW9]|uniref:hypothetical protein n=1 Tax=Faecalibacter sp. LW9 TaxID=3103144 RepID=UPI002AFF8B6E|nr:hypothetical protein [Faecalibacter sp. LW9]
MRNHKFQKKLPLFALMLAGIGVYATQGITKDTANTLIEGYIRNSSTSNCEPIDVNCTTQVTGQLCMTEDASPQQVWHKNAFGDCVLELYKVD